MSHGLLCLGYDQQSAGIFIDPVNQAWPFAAVLWKIVKMKNQGIDKGSTIVPMTRMYHHSCRFVYYQKGIIFMYNIQRNIFGSKEELVRRMFKHNLHHVARLHF